jgi:poly(A) polymerase
MWPGEVDFLFKILNKNNDDIRLVGGCTRDFLLNRRIADYDFATKHRPDSIVKILEENEIKYHSAGIKYGAVTAIIDNKTFEITTLRSDLNQRGRDTDVEFVDSYEIDAQRRDLTFNALYMDSNGKIYDYCGGKSDLKKGIVRFIGDPVRKIKEDNLRILRFFRFYTYGAYSFDFQSLQACKDYAYLVENLSAERITQEFFKILKSNYPVKVLKIMDRCGVLRYILGNNDDINFDNLEVFYSEGRNKNPEQNYLAAMALILLANRDLKPRLILKKSEKFFLKTVKITI